MKLKNCKLSKEEKLAYQKKLSEFTSKNEHYNQLIDKAVIDLQNIGIDINDISLKTDESKKLQFHLEPCHFSVKKPINKKPVPLNANKNQVDIWSEFLKCKKIPIKSTVYSPKCEQELAGNITTKGNEVCALWLTGKVDNKPYEFALSIVKPTKNNNNLTSFTISMSVLVSKEQNLWVELSRFDSKGPIHFNYTDKNGNFYEDVDDLELSSPPHFHVNSDKAEVITNLPYAHKTNGIISDKIKDGDSTALHDAVLEMMKFCNVHENIINPYITNDFNFHNGFNIFDEESFIIPENTEELDLLFNYYNDINDSDEDTDNKGVSI